MRLVDLTGRRFGALLVLRQDGTFRNGRARVKAWLCRCDCGAEKLMRGQSLTSGSSKTCGCGRSKHGACLAYRQSREYVSWHAMMDRCYRTKHRSFKNYGGRGIKVCKRWHEAANFIADMGPRPPGRSLERIDNDGDYEPGNCRWATTKEQAANKRTRRAIVATGRVLSIPEWSELTGISRSTIAVRLRTGWSPDAAVTTPVDVRYSRASSSGASTI